MRKDLGMTHAVHHGLEIGHTGEQPGRMSVAQVVDAYFEVHPDAATATTELH
jgi:hypothetical protein